MSRALSVIDDSGQAVFAALKSALDGGPAVLPLARGAVRTPVPPTVPSRVALVVQSSGSTGAPKRVALSVEALLASAEGSAAALGGQGQWLLALPVHHIAGINVLVRSIAARTEPVVVHGEHFDPLAFVEAASKLRNEARFTSLVPAQLAALLETPKAVDILRGFTRILVGGQSTPAMLLAHALDLGLNVTRSYGSSETSGGCVYDGVPFPDVTMRVVNDDGEGEGEGEVELGGPTLAEGYLGDDALTSRQFYADATGRWYRTADAGSITRGVLSITGRLDDVIISGGVKVSLSAVERIVTALGGLGGAVVVGRAHERWGEVPVVVATTAASLERIRYAVERDLGVEARPAEVVVVESIPVLSSGKPDRNALTNLLNGST